ncbi:hypothetical protein E4U55_004904 [Claviceps digitariae]|nr:hypothetical protein E4U55_004904 [Claviceps digitariae]
MAGERVDSRLSVRIERRGEHTAGNSEAVQSLKGGGENVGVMGVRIVDRGMTLHIIVECKQCMISAEGVNAGPGRMYAGLVRSQFCYGTPSSFSPSFPIASPVHLISYCLEASRLLAVIAVLAATVVIGLAAAAEGPEELDHDQRLDMPAGNFSTRTTTRSLLLQCRACSSVADDARETTMDHDDESASPTPARDGLSARQSDDNDATQTATPTSTTPTPTPTPTPDGDEDDAAPALLGAGAHDDNGERHVRSLSSSRRRRKKKSKKERNPGLVKKLSFVTHLLKTLDLLVFAELSGLYYMECSMFRFLLRAVGQYMYLTPKDESFPFLMPAGRVHVLLVVIPNLICMLLHLFTPLPRGPDFHRGYQHGGLIVDFVGQRPATYRMYYLFTDFAILAIQCLMLTVHTQREQLRVLLKTFRPILPELADEMQVAAAAVAAARSAQDLDAEERGVLAHAPNATASALTTATIDEHGGIEMRDMNRPLETAEVGEQNGEAASLLQRNTSQESPRAQLSDIMNSGNAVLGNYYIIQSVMSAAGDLERTAAHSLRTISYEATFATLQARRRAALAQSATIRRPNR